MIYKIGEEVEFKTPWGIKLGTIKRKQYHWYYITISYSKWCKRTHKVPRKNIIGYPLVIERN